MNIINMIRLQFKFALGFMLCTTFIPQVEAAETDLATVRKDYPTAVKRLKQLYSRVVASGSISKSSTKTPASPMVISACEINVMDGSFRAVIANQAQDQSGNLTPINRNVYCASPDMGFHAGAGKINQNLFMLMNISNGYENRIGEADDPILSSFRDAAGKFLFAPFLISGWDQPDFSDASSYQIVSVEPTRIEETPALRMKYLWKSQSAGPEFSGEIDVLPSRGWVATRHLFKGKARLQGPGAPANTMQDYTIVQTVDYGADYEGIAVPSRVRHSFSQVESVMVFESIKFGVETNPGEFRPSRYGLPDITKPAGHPESGYAVYVFSGLAIGSLALAVWIRRRSN
jgi:hypothetical protein